MSTLTLGISPCPNDVFIFSGLLLNKVQVQGARFEIDFQDIENLNARANAAALDVVKISYANYIHCQHEYELLSCGGALGRGVGPLLLVNEGKAEGRRSKKEENASPSVFPLLVPGANTTANFLLDFYANSDGNRPLPKRYLPFDALYEELRATPGAQGVVIHEKRFTYAQDGLTPDTGFGRVLGKSDRVRYPARRHLRSSLPSQNETPYEYDTKQSCLGLCPLRGGPSLCAACTRRT